MSHEHTSKDTNTTGSDLQSVRAQRKEGVSIENQADTVTHILSKHRKRNTCEHIYENTNTAKHLQAIKA